MPNFLNYVDDKLAVAALKKGSSEYKS